ncbi:class I SAM-dependent methyltransferase [Microbacterium oxydans]|nr:class I SAM-dependent methyltransferase [Microbacterium sp. B19(2022)]
MKDWAGVGEAYAASFADLCAGTFPVMRDALGTPGDRSLLDAGAGDGTLAAAWSAAGWGVTACEPEASMRAVSRRWHPAIEPLDGALPDLPFDDGAFDVVVANFVLNHVASPRASAAELRRVSRGTVVATTWTMSPSWLWAEITERAGLEPFVGTKLPAAEDFERTPDGFAGMLRDAGLEPVTVAEHLWTWNARPEALWASVEGGVAGAGALYAGLGADDRRRFRAAFDLVVEERRTGGVLPLEHRAAIAVGAAV